MSNDLTAKKEFIRKLSEILAIGTEIGAVKKITRVSDWNDAVIILDNISMEEIAPRSEGMK